MTRSCGESTLRLNAVGRAVLCAPMSQRSATKRRPYRRALAQISSQIQHQGSLTHRRRIADPQQKDIPGILPPFRGVP